MAAPRRRNPNYTRIDVFVGPDGGLYKRNSNGAYSPIAIPPARRRRPLARRPARIPRNRPVGKRLINYGYTFVRQKTQRARRMALRRAIRDGYPVATLANRLNMLSRVHRDDLARVYGEDAEWVRLQQQEG